MLNHNHLYYFYMVVKQGGVCNASNYLRLAQPSLSMQIKTLEDRIQKNLFQKIGRKLELTSEGKVVFTYCERMFGVVDELVEYLDDSELIKQKKIKVGLTADIDRIFITDMLSSLLLDNQNDSPPIISMQEASHTENIEKILEKKVDVFISNRNVDHEGIVKLAEIKMPIVAVASPAYAQAKNLFRDGTLSELLCDKEIKLVLPGDNLSLRIETDFFLHKNKLKNKIVFESDILFSVVSAIKDGLGIGFIPLPFVSKEIEQNKLLSFGNPQFHWSHKIYLYGKENACSDPMLKDFQNRFDSVHSLIHI